MNSTIRFRQAIAAVLVCVLCGAIAFFRERGEAVAQPPTRGDGAIFDPSVLDPVPQATAKAGRTPTAAEAISQLARSVVTIAKVEPGTKDRNVPDTRIQAGVVIDPRGYVLTLSLDDSKEKDDDPQAEQHVVVRFSNQNQQEYPAKVVENDRLRGLAILRIEAAHPLSAISLENLQKPVLNGTVLLVPSVPRQRPAKGWITFQGVSLGEKSPYRFPYAYIESNIRLPEGEAGSLLVTGHGDPIGILVNQVGPNQDGTVPSHAIALDAVLNFIDSDPALQEVLGHLAPNPPPATAGPNQSDDDLMESLRTRKSVTGEPRAPETPEIPDAYPRRSPSPYDSDPPTVTFGPPIPLGRQLPAVTDSPAEQKLIEQLQSRESAAAELAAKIRTLQASGRDEQNQTAIRDSERELKSQLGTAFDLKLQLEELQVKELQSKLSRLERQIGQRRALREKIIARRAAQLVEESGLQWDTSGTSPQRSPWGTSSERQVTAPAASPAVVEKLRKRADLLIDGMRAGEVKPAAVLSALQDLARVDSKLGEGWGLLLNISRKMHNTGRITEAELLQIEAACEEAQYSSRGANNLPSTRDSSPAVVKKFKRRTEYMFAGIQGGIIGPADMLAALEDLKRELIEPVPAAEWLVVLENLLAEAEKRHAADQLTDDELLEIKAAYKQARSANEGASLPPKADYPQPATADRSGRLTGRLKGWTQVRLSGSTEMRVVFGVHTDASSTDPTYFVQRQVGKVVQTPLIIQFAASSKRSITGRLDVYPTDSNESKNPSADEFLRNNAVAFQISEQDTQNVLDGVDVTKVVAMRFTINESAKLVEKIELETLESSKFPPGTDMIEEAERHAKIVAVLRLSQQLAAAPDPATNAEGRTNTP